MLLLFSPVSASALMKDPKFLSALPANALIWPLHGTLPLLPTHTDDAIRSASVAALLDSPETFQGIEYSMLGNIQRRFVIPETEATLFPLGGGVDTDLVVGEEQHEGSMQEFFSSLIYKISNADERLREKGTPLIVLVDSPCREHGGVLFSAPGVTIGYLPYLYPQESERVTAAVSGLFKGLLEDRLDVSIVNVNLPESLRNNGFLKYYPLKSYMEVELSGITNLL